MPNSNHSGGGGSHSFNPHSGGGGSHSFDIRP